MSEKWTIDQLSAINTTDKGVIVSAAAGSGKTAVLVERTIKLLLDEEKQIPADTLLAVTFTNDAASQMREKLNNAINIKIEENPTNEWFQLQQVRLQNAKITTINAFCFDLVKSNIHQFDISNGVRILDETENSVMLSNALENVIEKYYSESPEMMGMLFDAFCTIDDKNIFDIVTQLYNFSRSLPFKDSWFKRVLDGYDSNSELFLKWKKIIISEINSLFMSAKKSVEEALTVSKSLKYHSKLMEIINKDYGIVTEIEKYINNGEWDKLSSCCLAISWDRFNGKADKNAPENSAIEEAQVEYIKNLRQSYKDTFENIRTKLQYSEKQIESDLIHGKKILEYLLQIVNTLWEEIWEQKVTKNAIDFADVEIMSLQLLAEETSDGYRNNFV